jgi:hypothetical protein
MISGVIGHGPIPVPAFGDMNRELSGRHTADSVTVTNGTITTGTVADTRSINQVYLEVAESGEFKIDFSFTDVQNSPFGIRIVGRYVGSSAHFVEVKAWNFTDETWDDVLPVGTQDLPNSATDDSYEFTFPDINGDYISSNEVRVRIDHESNAVPTHDMFVDYIDIVEASLSLPTASTWVVVDDNDDGESKNATVSGTDGKITIILPGTYTINASLSFNCSVLVVFHMALFVNGSIENKVHAVRSVSDATDVGSMTSQGLVALSTGDELEIKLMTDHDDAFVSIDRFNFVVERIS